MYNMERVANEAALFFAYIRLIYIKYIFIDYG
jgi:hypothetical protein